MTLPFVFGVPAGDPVEIEVLRIDRLLVDDLGQFGADVLGPVCHLRRLAMVAQRLDVDDAGNKSRAVRVALLSDDRAAVVHDHRLAATGVDRRLAIRAKMVAADIGCDDVHVVLERPRPVRDLEKSFSVKGAGREAR
jgi:hypothetical protein